MPNPNAEQIVLDAFKEELGLDEIDTKSTLAQLGLDSLGYVHIAQTIAESTKIELDDYLDHRARRIEKRAKWKNDRESWERASYTEVFREITPEHLIVYVAFASERGSVPN